MPKPSRVARSRAPRIIGLALAAIAALPSAPLSGSDTTSEVRVSNVTKDTRISFTGSFKSHDPVSEIVVTAAVTIPDVGSRLVVIAKKAVSKTEVAFSGRINFSDYIEQQPARPIEVTLILTSPLAGEFGQTKVTR